MLREISRCFNSLKDKNTEGVLNYAFFSHGGTNGGCRYAFFVPLETLLLRNLYLSKHMLAMYHIQPIQLYLHFTYTCISLIYSASRMALQESELEE